MYFVSDAEAGFAKARQRVTSQEAVTACHHRHLGVRVRLPDKSMESDRGNRYALPAQDSGKNCGKTDR